MTAMEPNRDGVATQAQPDCDGGAARVRRRKTGVIRPIGPYSKHTVLGRLDARTREGRALAAFRAELVAHVGGKPTAAQGILIAQAAQLRLRIALMDDRFAATGEVGDMEGRAYRAWVNTLAQLLGQLGPVRAEQPAKPPTLADYLAAGQGQAGGGGG